MNNRDCGISATDNNVFSVPSIVELYSESSTTSTIAIPIASNPSMVSTSTSSSSSGEQLSTNIIDD